MAKLLANGYHFGEPQSLLLEECNQLVLNRIHQSSIVNRKKIFTFFLSVWKFLPLHIFSLHNFQQNNNRTGHTYSPPKFKQHKP